MPEYSHSGDAGRYGGSQPSSMVGEFINLASQMHPADRLQTTGGHDVELSYNPGAMDPATRFRLLGYLLAYSQGQESWHGDWFLWNVVRVGEPGGGEVRLSIS